MAEVTYSRRAREDLKGIWRYTFQAWGEAQANRYLTDLGLTMASLLNNPSLGSPREHIRPGCRAMLCGRHMIDYFARGDGIHIVRVLHERMDVARAF
jgi:toxin ParE1/3/4